MESLIERRFAVFSINPKQLDRFRDRHSPAGAKDNGRDAFVLADSLRSGPPNFLFVRIDDPLIIPLRSPGWKTLFDNPSFFRDRISAPLWRSGASTNAGSPGGPR